MRTFDQDLCEQLCFGPDVVDMVLTMARAHDFDSQQGQHKCLRLAWALSRFTADKVEGGRFGLLQVRGDLIGETGLLDPQYNLNIGFQRLRVLVGGYGWDKGVAAYVWGEENLRAHLETCGNAWLERLPEAVRDVLDKVLEV